MQSVTTDVLRLVGRNFIDETPIHLTPELVDRIVVGIVDIRQRDRNALQQIEACGDENSRRSWAVELTGLLVKSVIAIEV